MASQVIPSLWVSLPLSNNLCDIFPNFYSVISKANNYLMGGRGQGRKEKKITFQTNGMEKA